MLKPSLPDNRRKFDRLGQWQKRVAAVVISIGVLLIMMLPSRLLLAAAWLMLGILAVVHFGLELARLRIYRRDLREQPRRRHTESDTSSTQ